MDILSLIGEVSEKRGYVYLIRIADLYKIGVTVNVERRMEQLKPDEVLAVKEAINTYGIEKILHKRYAHCRLPQSEYFRLTPQEVLQVKEILGDSLLSNNDLDVEKDAILKNIYEIISGFSLEHCWNENYCVISDDEAIRIGVNKNTTSIINALVNGLDVNEGFAMSDYVKDALQRRATKQKSLSPIIESLSKSDLLKETQLFMSDFYGIIAYLFECDVFDYENKEVGVFYKKFAQEKCKENGLYWLKNL
ncbi:MAG: GIY-YIG nuclease family protein [Clostridia bacterium]|nr:GIY-YIG nuclease family protein [Clostridia bacterium]